MAASSLPYFKGVPRQRGRGLGALAGTIARTAFPIMKRYIVPVVKKVGRDLVSSAVPEIGEVLSGKTSVKKALKRTASNTISKQIGGGRRKRRKISRVQNVRRKPTKTRKRVISRKSKTKRSRDDFFSKIP